MKTRIMLAIGVACLAFSTISSAEIKPAIAIMDFQPKGADASSASIVSDLFRDFIVSHNRFIVVDRASMQSILQEQNLQQELGCSSEECAVNLGKILGVTNIVIGTLGKLGNISIISARVVNIESAKIEWSRSAKVQDFSSIDVIINALVNDMINTIFGGAAQMPVTTVAPVQPAPVVQQPVQQQQPKPDSGGQNVIVIQQQGAPPAAPQPYAQQPAAQPRGQDLGFELELGLFPKQNFFTHWDYDGAEWGETTGDPGYFNFSFAFFMDLFYIGINRDVSTLKEGSTIFGESETGDYSFTLSTKNTLVFTDMILAARVPGHDSRGLVFIFWRSFSYVIDDDAYDPERYYGPGIGFQTQFGSPHKNNPADLPFGLLFQLGLRGAYMFFDTPDTFPTDYFGYGLGLRGNVGLGVILKGWGTYLMVSYRLNALISFHESYDAGFSMNNHYLVHGIAISIGTNFNMGAIN
ncbi:hypothetical protein KAR04_08395 [Candidatus Calescamantes bacterium]|nr:hypothetical protein [Candidatus Calescamantes bacterium]